MILGTCSCPRCVSQTVGSGGGVTPTLEDSGGKALRGRPESLQLVNREMPGELNLLSPIEPGEDRGPMSAESIGRIRADKGPTVSTADHDKLDSGACLFQTVR